MAGTKADAEKFAKEWRGKGDENQDTQRFWIGFFQDVLGLGDAIQRLRFEVPVSTGRPKSVLPVQFKFGTDDEPQYHQFTTLEELTEFYIYTMSYIQGCYTAGWARKDTFDYSPYEEAIAAL